MFYHKSLRVQRTSSVGAVSWAWVKIRVSWLDVRKSALWGWATLKADRAVVSVTQRRSDKGRVAGTWDTFPGAPACVDHQSLTLSAQGQYTAA